MSGFPRTFIDEKADLPWLNAAFDGQPIGLKSDEFLDAAEAIGSLEHCLIITNRPMKIWGRVVGGWTNPKTKSSIVSIASIDDGCDDQTILRRLNAVIRHEWGHTKGLKHCQDSCVMAQAGGLESLDKRSEVFCTNCTKRLAAPKTKNWLAASVLGTCAVGFSGALSLAFEGPAFDMPFT